MSISNEEVEKLIEQYRDYPEKIVNRFYYFVSPAVKDELCHVGLIGLWKGILAYYKKAPEKFDRKKFIATICSFIRYEMADLFLELKLIRISDNQWRNFVNVTKLLASNPDISEEQLKSIITDAGLRYDWYLKAKEVVNTTSLDMPISEDIDADIYNFLVYNDNEVRRFESQSYIDYIVDSAMYGIKLERDKELIRTWLKSVNSKKELDFTELSKMYKLTPSMVRVIINRFINICRFVRDCEYEVFKNPDGVIYLPEIPEKNKTHNGRKIPGIKWVLPNRKWKVEITIGKRKSVYIGHFEKYEDAVRARRDAEIKYRGFSDIEI
jgi:hypothetical protein